MMPIECFDAIDVAIGNLKGVINIVRNIQCKEILELFQSAKEWESLKYRVSNLEVGAGVNGTRTSDVLKVNEQLATIENNYKD